MMHHRDARKTSRFAAFQTHRIYIFIYSFCISYSRKIGVFLAIIFLDSPQSSFTISRSNTHTRFPRKFHTSHTNSRFLDFRKFLHKKKEKRVTIFFFPSSVTFDTFRNFVSKTIDRSRKDGSVQNTQLKKKVRMTNFRKKLKKSHFHFSKISVKKDRRSHFYKKWQSTDFSEWKLSKIHVTFFTGFSHFSIFSILHTYT